MLQSLPEIRALTYLWWRDLYLYTMNKNTEQSKHQEFKVLLLLKCVLVYLNAFGHRFYISFHLIFLC